MEIDVGRVTGEKYRPACGASAPYETCAATGLGGCVATSSMPATQACH